MPYFHDKNLAEFHIRCAMAHDKVLYLCIRHVLVCSY